MTAAAGRGGMGAAGPFGPAASITSATSAGEKPVNSIGIRNWAHGC